MLNHPEYWATLLGTGGTWFLYDISYYGTAIFMPQILKTICEPTRNPHHKQSSHHNPTAVLPIHGV